MTDSKLAWIGVAAVLLLAARVISSFLERRRHSQQAKLWGCQPEPKLPTKLPLGIDYVIRLALWDNDFQLPQFAHELYKECGSTTYEQNFLGSKALVTNDPKNVQAVLATQFSDFELGPVRRGNFGALLGSGIFTSDGKEWLVASEHSRALLKPQFSRGQVADLDSFEFHADIYFQHMPVGFNGWTETVNLQPMLSRLVLDVATEFLCGESVFAQVLALPYTPENAPLKKKFHQGTLDWTRFADCFDAATRTLGVRIRMFEYYWLYSPSSFHKQCKEVHRFMDYYVHKALAETAPGREKDSEEGGRYVFLNELAKETRDPIELRSQVLNVLLAGRDTTAGTMSWIMTNLARNSRVFAKLRATIIEDFGTFNSPKPITFETMKACSYLQYIINETLRLYPNVCMNSRRATKDTTLPRGGGPDGEAPVYVRKGKEVNYYAISMHRRKDIWGEDAEEFVPERWENKKRSWEFLPFNGGPRVCLGQQFALTEAAFMTIRMLQKFDKLENMDPDPVIRHTYTVTTNPKEVLVRWHAASD